MITAQEARKLSLQLTDKDKEQLLDLDVKIKSGYVSPIEVKYVPSDAMRKELEVAGYRVNTSITRGEGHGVDSDSVSVKTEISW